VFQEDWEIKTEEGVKKSLSTEEQNVPVPPHVGEKGTMSELSGGGKEVANHWGQLHSLP